MCSSEISVSAKKHKDTVIYSSRQSKFVFSVDGKITLTGDGKSKALSTEVQVAKAEIIRCISIIGSNCVFRAADADNDKYRKMFPDFATTNSYQQEAGKVIAPYPKDIILNEPKELPFSFRFDEATTSQIKKQYDGYATYHSKHFD